VFLLICWLFLHVSILVFFVFLFMEFEYLKLEFHIGNQVLNTRFPRRFYFPHQLPITYKSSFRDLNSTFELEFQSLEMLVCYIVCKHDN